MESQQKRLMLALFLSFGLATVWTIFFTPKPPPPDAVAQTTDGGTPAVAPQPAPAPSGQPAPQAAAPAATPAPEQNIPEEKVMKKSEGLSLTFTNDGAGLDHAYLQGDKMREQPEVSLLEGFQRMVGKKAAEAPQMDMAVPIPGQPRPLAVGIKGSQTFPENARYRLVESPDGKKLSFTARQGNLEVEKVFEFPNPGFEFGMSVTVRNLGQEALSGELAVHMVRGVTPGSEVKGGYFSGVGNVSYATCMVGEDLRQKAPEESGEPEYKGPVQWLGVNQQYFLASVFPVEGPREGRCVLEAPEQGRIATTFFPLQVPPGGSATQRFAVFIGPKDVELLRTVDERLKALGVGSTAAAASGISSINASAFPHLDKAVDFGMWAVICKVLLGILKFFFSVFHNWGVAIIALTVLVKLALVPLSHKAMVSAEQMKKLQPRMEEIRKKYADDRDRQNLETMKLYQEAKVNPLGGCLPMLLQMPIWIALFTTLRNSYELYREPFISPLWADLTYKDPTYLLPIALGVTMIVTQKLQPQMMDPVQAKIMIWFMPIFFTFIMLQYPAGLTLYIFTNNVLSIAQQYGLKKWMEKKGLAAPAVVTTKPEKKNRKDENERQSTRKRTDP